MLSPSFQRKFKLDFLIHTLKDSIPEMSVRHENTSGVIPSSWLIHFLIFPTDVLMCSIKHQERCREIIFSDKCTLIDLEISWISLSLEWILLPDLKITGLCNASVTLTFRKFLFSENLNFQKVWSIIFYTKTIKGPKTSCVHKH